jgi:Tfp pilus assembly protein PilF
MRGTKGLAVVLALVGLSSVAWAGHKVGPKDAWQSDRMLSNGYRYVAHDQAKKAVKFFEKAVKADKTNAEAWQALGAAYTAMGEDGKAQDAYSDGGVKPGPTVDANQMCRAARYSGQAYSYLAKGNEAGARHYFKAALALIPGYSHAKAGLNTIGADGKDDAGDGKDDAADDKDSDDK